VCVRSVNSKGAKNIQIWKVQVSACEAIPGSQAYNDCQVLMAGAYNRGLPWSKISPKKNGENEWGKGGKQFPLGNPWGNFAYS
jgi:hypothetical protein